MQIQEGTMLSGELLQRYQEVTKMRLEAGEVIVESEEAVYKVFDLCSAVC